ncbi:MAG: 23S ribosomal RNA methyltransferase Erm [Leucobacter sp.]
MPRSFHGGRHELGQNFLVHQPAINTMTTLTAATRGPILELGAGDGALTTPLARLGRLLTAIDIDEHRVAHLRHALPGVEIEHADALAVPLDHRVIVGNIPFHLTTPILRRVLSVGTWSDAVLLTQWEVARKRCGVGGSTMLTAQTSPWFTFTLRGRVPSSGFRPSPSVDGGIISISRRSEPLVPTPQRAAYERFVRAVFTGRGGTLDRIIANASRTVPGRAKQLLRLGGVHARALPKDLKPEQWATLWNEIR